METKVLEEIGFSKGEVKVYFALIELGETTIGPLAKKSGVTAAKVYPILDKLSEKGLASHIIKSNTKYFRAANPKQIIEYIKERENKLSEEKKQIQLLIPKIEARRKNKEEFQTAEVYEGYEGMKTLYNEALEVLKKNREDFIGFTLGEEEYENKESLYFFIEYDAKRKNLGIKTKLLGHESQRKFMKDATKENDRMFVKYLPYKLPTGVIIFGDKVATIVWGKTPTAFVIKSKTASGSYKKFFEDMWKIAKR